MIHSSTLKKILFRRLFGFFFIVIIFSVTACGHHTRPSLSACLTKQEKQDLEFFFRSLIFEHYGAFVLFGSKPLCFINLSDSESKEAEAAFQKWFASLSNEERAQIEAVKKKKTQPNMVRECNLYRGWQALKKVRENFKMKNFIFRLVPIERPDGKGVIPDSYELVLINVQQTALILAENYEIFKRAGKMDFHPLQAVFDAQDPNSLFWKNVFSMENHLAKGLLFGFGLRNSLFGNWRFSCLSNEQFALEFSEKYRETIIDYLKNSLDDVFTASVESRKGSASSFTIPLFGMIPGDETAEQYKKEKIAIETLYRRQDIVEVTLQRLAGL